MQSPDYSGLPRMGMIVLNKGFSQAMGPKRFTGVNRCKVASFIPKAAKANFFYVRDIQRENFEHKLCSDNPGLRNKLDPLAAGADKILLLFHNLCFMIPSEQYCIIGIIGAKELRGSDRDVNSW